MPAALTKEDLIAVTLREFEKLQTLIRDVPYDIALARDAEETSIKDVIAHRAHWIDLFLGWYRDGQAGRLVHIPAEGYKWNQLKAYNAKLRQDQAGIGWNEAQRMLLDRHGKLLKFINNLSEYDLYAHPMAGGGNHWPTGRWAEAAGPSHYRSASKWIRGQLRGG